MIIVTLCPICNSRLMFDRKLFVEEESIDKPLAGYFCLNCNYRGGDNE